MQKLHAKVTELCTSGEEIRYIAVQKKPVVTIAPDAVVLTNKRVIVCRPKLLGFTFDDTVWPHVHDIHVKEGLLGATITLTKVSGHRVEVDSLPKAQARKLYQFGQEMEEQMHHIRRQRDLEDKRAQAGGITIGGQFPPAMPPPLQPAADDPATKLMQLKTFFEQGLITSAEYEAKKVDILSRF